MVMSINAHPGDQPVTVGTGSLALVATAPLAGVRLAAAIAAAAAAGSG
jgi:hypothetical protein